MKHSSNWKMTSILVAFRSGVCLFLIQSQFVYSQTWTSNSLSISVQGHESSACNPRSGDEINMKRCSIKMRVDRNGRTPVFVVLPWETVSVQNAVAIDAKTILFMGMTQTGFYQISVYSDASKSIIYKQLAQKAALSPEHDFIAYETYQPPHGSEAPRVQIEIVSTRGIGSNRAWEQRVIFRAAPKSNSYIDQAEQGEWLCARDLFWSKSGDLIGFCTINVGLDFERLVLASAHLGVETTLVKQIDTKDICRQMGQRPNERCTLFVEKMSIGAAGVDVLLRSTGSKGYKEEQVNYPLESFSKE
jgi:hypothetical protein